MLGNFGLSSDAFKFKISALNQWFGAHKIMFLLGVRTKCECSGKAQPGDEPERGEWGRGMRRGRD